MFENIIDPAWDILMIPFGLVNDHVLGAFGYSCGFEPATAARRPAGVPVRRGIPARTGVPMGRGVPPQRVNIPATSRGAVPVRPMGRGMPPVTRTGFVRYMRG
jgi:hypothetical protein